MASAALIACGGSGDSEAEPPPTVPEFTASVERAYEISSPDGTPQEVQDSLSLCTSELAADGKTATEIIDEGCRKTGQAICDLRQLKRHWPDDFREDVERALSHSQLYTFARLDEFHSQGEISADEVTATKNAIREELCPPYWP